MKTHHIVGIVLIGFGVVMYVNEMIIRLIAAAAGGM